MKGWHRAAALGLGSLLLLGASPPAPGPVLSPQPPHDVAAPGTKDAYDNYSWAMFVALNWPAVRTGAPQGGKKIGEEMQAPRVWETFQDPIEVFKDEGEPETTTASWSPSGRKAASREAGPCRGTTTASRLRATPPWKAFSWEIRRWRARCPRSGSATPAIPPGRRKARSTT